ncbi:unnamed protein product [Orchesella dallaii]|uniref:acid phosphatase n=1 Tax=Orchesella dallaii TaxID=48710 RepID=A0ABP1QS33_9HEXA
MQHYRLGKFIRSRYDEFISRDYSPYEILVQSSDVDRALMSASTNLAGLYPPADNFSTWNQNLTWQPIPIHSLASQLDNKLRLNASCPRYDELRTQFRSSDIMHQINEENKDLYEYLTNHSGRSIHDPQQVDYLYDVLYIENLYHKKVPDWAAKILTSVEMRNLTAFSFKMITYTTEMKRLKGGPLIKEFIQHMKDRISGNMDKRRKLFMYSAHDTTVATVLNSLDLYAMIPPPYASLVLVELLKNATSKQYFVRIGFKNTTEDPYILTLPECQQICPFDDFVKLTKHIIPGDWSAECRKAGFVQYLGGSYLGILIGGILTMMLVLAVPVMLCIRHRRTAQEPPRYPYLHLQMDDEEA